MATVYTVGHGTRTTEELASILDDAGVAGLVDVRRFPGSRRHPHFSKEALEHSLPSLGLAYEWRGEALGGRRKAGGVSRHVALRNNSFRSYADYMDSDEFRHALARLEDDARAAPVAIMCAESLWWRCHRKLIADALVLDGFEVVHLIHVGKSQPHKPPDEMRADEHNRPVYDLGVTQELPRMS